MIVNLGKLTLPMAIIVALAGVSRSPAPQEGPEAEAYKKGLALYAQQKYKEAVDAFKQAVKLNPGNANAFCQLGNSYWQADQLPEAITAYKEALRLSPKMPEALYGLGGVYGI